MDDVFDTSIDADSEALEERERHDDGDRRGEALAVRMTVRDCTLEPVELSEVPGDALLVALGEREALADAKELREETPVRDADVDALVLRVAKLDRDTDGDPDAVALKDGEGVALAQREGEGDTELEEYEVPELESVAVKDGDTLDVAVVQGVNDEDIDNNADVDDVAEADTALDGVAVRHDDPDAEVVKGGENVAVEDSDGESVGPLDRLINIDGAVLGEEPLDGLTPAVLDTVSVAPPVTVPQNDSDDD